MSIIYSYPIKGAPANDDLILISDSSDSDKTKQIRVSTLPGGSSAGVSFINALNGAVTLTGGTGVTLNTVGNNIEIEAAVSGGTVTGTGTENNLAMWSAGGTAIQDSIVQQNAAGNTLSINADNVIVNAAITHASDPDTFMGFSAEDEFSVTAGSNKNLLVNSDKVVLYREGNAKAETGDGGFTLLGGGGSASNLRFSCSQNNHWIDINGPEHTGAVSYALTLPNTLPSVANQILESNASGTLSWIPTPSGGGGETYDINSNNAVSPGTDTNVNINLTSTSGTDNSFIKLSAGPDTTGITLSSVSSSEVSVTNSRQFNYLQFTADSGANFNLADQGSLEIDGGTGIDTVSDGTSSVRVVLADTTVSAGTYGSTDTIPTIAIDAQGRITSATSVAVATGPEMLIRSVTHATTRTDPASPSEFELPHLASTVTAFKQIKFEPATSAPTTPTYNVATSFARPSLATNYVKVVVKLSVLTGPATGFDEKIMIGLHNNKNDVQGVNLSYNWQATGDLDVEIDSGDQMMQMQFTTYIPISNLLLENGENAVAGETVYLYLKGIFDSSTPTAEPSIIIGRQWNTNPTTTAALNRAAGPITIDVYEIQAANYSANPEFIDP